MKVRDIMNPNPVCCTPETPLSEVAKMMVKNDCGSIPIVIDSKTKRPVVGMITDRDIVCRSLALGKNPLDLRVKDCMTSSLVTVKPDDSVEHCCNVMGRLQVRRLPAIDENGTLVGLITQAHIAQNLSESKTGEVLKKISKKPGVPAAVSVANL